MATRHTGKKTSSSYSDPRLCGKMEYMLHVFRKLGSGLLRQCYPWPARPLHDWMMNLSFFFLRAAMPMRRIIDFGAGFSASFTLIGAVPGGVHGACALRAPRRCREDDGPDCFFLIFLA
jgi:hypothetical protein